MYWYILGTRRSIYNDASNSSFSREYKNLFFNKREPIFIQHAKRKLGQIILVVSRFKIVDYFHKHQFWASN